VKLVSLSSMGEMVRTWTHVGRGSRESSGAGVSACEASCELVELRRASRGAVWVQGQPPRCTKRRIGGERGAHLGAGWGVDDESESTSS